MRINRRVSVEDQAESPYLEVPFEVRGEPSLEVTLAYDKQSAVIDLGCEGPAGWRGWSGASKDRFVIASSSASGGYLPGELENGVWKVVLGLHRVPAAGVDVTLTINLPAIGGAEPEPEAPRPKDAIPASQRRALPAAAGRVWLAGDCHAHSLHSDGSLSVRQLAARSAANGLDFLAVTDHNTVSHFPELAAAGDEHGITLIPGQEVTTARGHANAYGRIGWVDFRHHPDRWFEQVDGDGGFLSINHPVADDCAWQWPLNQKPTHAEIMHQTWVRQPTDTALWAWWNAWGTDVIPLAGGDFHRPEDGHPTGRPTTWVSAEDHGEAAVLSALKGGATALSIGTDGPVLLRVDGQLTAIDAEGAVLVDIDGRRRLVHGSREDLRDTGNGPYRLETPDRRILAISL